MWRFAAFLRPLWKSKEESLGFGLFGQKKRFEDITPGILWQAFFTLLRYFIDEMINQLIVNISSGWLIHNDLYSKLQTARPCILGEWQYCDERGLAFAAESDVDRRSTTYAKTSGADESGYWGVSVSSDLILLFSWSFYLFKTKEKRRKMVMSWMW